MIKLSDSELYIMNIIWSYKNVTSFDILNIVEEDKKISCNTVRTALGRMVKKKAIAIAGKNGKIYTYEPLIDRNEYLEFELNKIIDFFYHGDSKKFLNDIINKMSK